MKVIITGGGTGGHLYPALAIGHSFADLGAEVHYIGSVNGIEKYVMNDDIFPTELLPVEALRGKKPLAMLKSLFQLELSYRKAKKAVKAFSPDLIIGTGGYASFPVLKAGQKLGVKTLIHEANAEMGKANAGLAKNADCLCLTYETTAAVKDCKNILVTGMPIRESVKGATAEAGGKYLGIDEDTLLVTVTGGSQGSHHINEAMAAYYEKWNSEKKVLFYHIVGKQNTEDAKALKKYPFVRVKDYETNMDLVLARTDICVGRAGASFLAEIAMRGIASILVPYPFSHGHQEKNAAYFHEMGAAYMVLDGDLPKPLFRALDELIDDEEKRNRLAAAMRKEAKANALEEIVKAGQRLMKR